MKSPVVGEGLSVMRAVWNGAVLAESSDTVVVEGNHYFPPDSLDRRYFTESGARSLCPWKGIAHHYDIEVDGRSNPGAAWYYPRPSLLAHRIRNRVAFWRGVTVQESPSLSAALASDGKG